MKFIVLMFLFASTSAFSECTDEKITRGSEVLSLSLTHDIWIKNSRHQFIRFNNEYPVNTNQNYLIQYRERSLVSYFSNSDDYNQKYLPYYSVSRMKLFIERNLKLFQKRNYSVNQIGNSVKGEPLFYIGPNQLDYNKKTIVMFGRHHGDEGTANWIIEGFVKHFFNTDYLMNQFNLLLYPMINPDGVNARSRYNANGRDLNRSWGVEGIKSLDEIISIFSHLESNLQRLRRPVIVLDMHGSFTQDFIYRVDKRFAGPAFYNLQQNFIHRLGFRDKWQKGSFQLSNGSPGMSRIRLITKYGLNAMTHETPRDITINNPNKRSVKTLMDQGVAIAYTIDELY